MSRVRILNLPKDATQESIKDFIQKGLPRDGHVEITDTFIKRNQQGVIRVAFVGFRAASSADVVSQRLNNAFFRTTKVTVDVAKGVGEAVSHTARIESEKAATRAARQAAQEETAAKRQREGVAQPEATTAADSDMPDEKRKRQEEFVKERLKDGAEWAGELMLPDQPKDDAREGDAEPEEDPMERQQRLATTTDDDFLASIMQSGPAETAGEDAQGDEQGATEASGNADEGVAIGGAPEKKEEESSVEIARRTSRVKATNLPFTTTEDDVKNFFSGRFGSLKEVHMPLTRDTKQPKGTAYVTFHDPADAVEAVEKGHMGVFQGRLLRVYGCEPDPHSVAAKEAAAAAEGAQSGAPNPAGEQSSYKAQKAAKDKASDSSLKWNSLYMQSHTAVDKMAKRLDVQRSDILSVEASGGAVRAAIAEAILTSEAKQVVGDEGIDFDVVQSSSALHKNRSGLTIIIKNLASGTSVQEVVKMFARFGAIDTVAAPSEGTFIIISFVHASDARTAFQRMGYKKVNNVPLFLEWAPLGSLRDTNEEAPGKEAEPAAAAAAAPSATENFTVYVSNIPFSVTEEALRTFLIDVAPRLAKAFDESVKRISLLKDKGQAFIQVADSSTFSYIISKVNGKAFEGRTVSAVASKRQQPPPQEENEGAAAGCPPGHDPLKLVVKNLPFEATEADLRELFKAFTEVKGVRVPRKVHRFSSHRENNHRGFGFVEFLSAEEAALAMKTLSSTHLYGRHLVLQYAKKHED